MIILSIETSCDETSVAILKKTRGSNVRFEVLAHQTLSQIETHKKYGGVFPSMAKREHAKNLPHLIAASLTDAGLLIERRTVAPTSEIFRTKLKKLLTREEEMFKAFTFIFENIQKPKIDAIAVTSGPGLEPTLWVGINAATAMNMFWKIPLYPINHMEGHIIASMLENKSQHKGTKSNQEFEIPKIKYPALALLISGGHTEIVRMGGEGKYKIIGATRDDAAGECFDKSARLLHLPYPGGPEISRLAAKARSEGIVASADLVLPRPMIHSHDLEFSFSGLKTAVLTRVNSKKVMSDYFKKTIALEVETSITDVLIHKLRKAIYETGSKTIIIGGGVSANNFIREKVKELGKEEAVEVMIPERELSTDNSLMIAAAGLLHIHNKEKPKSKLIAKGNWKVDQKYKI